MCFRIYDYITILIIDAYVTKKLFFLSFICDTHYSCISLKISEIICFENIKRNAPCIGGRSFSKLKFSRSKDHMNF